MGAYRISALLRFYRHVLWPSDTYTGTGGDQVRDSSYKKQLSLSNDHVEMKTIGTTAWRKSCFVYFLFVSFFFSVFPKGRGGFGRSLAKLSSVAVLSPCLFFLFHFFVSRRTHSVLGERSLRLLATGIVAFKVKWGLTQRRAGAERALCQRLARYVE